MPSLSAARFVAAAMTASVSLFFVTRAITWTAFPVFNDEALYVQYAQSIHQDWQKNKFISMNGFYRDWKPPLQYWIAAPVIGLGGDPVLTARGVALFVSMLGLLGFYLFTRELFSRAEGLLAMALYLFCPAVVFHNDQFTAETFLFSTAPFLYWAVLKLMQRGELRWLWFAAALLLGATLLLLKQSGFLLLGLTVALPFASLRKRAGAAKDTYAATSKPAVTETWNWRALVVNLSLVAAVVAGACLLVKGLIPSEFDATKERFNARWVLTPTELMKLPAEAWGRNLRVVGDYIGAYYSWLVPVFVSAFLWFSIRKRRIPELALASMCLGGAVAICFLLRGFNEYMFNTAIIAVLLPLLARTGVLIWELRSGGAERYARNGLLALAAVTLTFWIYQIILMAVSPGRYIERSTPWAVTNYLNSWSTGFGVREVLAMLEQIKEPGIVFADTQWGNPRTTIELYRGRRFPNLKVHPITKEFLDPDETRKLRDYARTLGPVHLAIYSAEGSGRRARWQANIESEMCEERFELKGYPRQTPIIVCRF